MPSNLIIQLSLSQLGQQIEIADPSLISEEMVGQAWSMMNDFIMDILDELGIEEDDEQFREIFIELCYRLILREMRTLFLFPIWEENFKDRLGTRKRGPRKSKGDS